MKKRFLWGIMGILIFGFNICFADEGLEPKERYGNKTEKSAIGISSKETKEKKPNLLCSFSQYMGYDNNVNLDSSRKGDTFLETRFRLGIEEPFYLGFALWENLKLKLTYNFTSIAYTEITDASIVDNNLNLNIQNQLVGRNILEFNYNFGVLDFLKYDPGDYKAHKATLSFKRYFTDRFYGRLGYGYLDKKYNTRKAKYGNGTESNSERKDNRHIAELELGYYLWEKTLLKLREQYYLNNSNDLYYDYYDYSSNKISLTAIQIFNEKFFGLLTFSEKFKNYDHRSVLDRSRAQEDELFTISGTLLYDFTPSTSISLILTYRENDSNEPFYEYTETISSIGFHYSF
jgi:hypothetical protein